MPVVKAKKELEEGMRWRGPGGGSHFGRGVHEIAVGTQGGRGSLWVELRRAGRSSAPGDRSLVVSGVGMLGEDQLTG